MTYAKLGQIGAADTLPRMPSWITPKRGETAEDVAFLSGAALATLHVVLARGEVSHALLRARLALRAAEACVGFSGRPERASDLRDEVHFLRPGDMPGPAGVVYQSWQQAVARPISVGALHKAMPQAAAENIATWLDRCDRRGAGQGGPVERSSAVLETVLAAAREKRRRR